MLKSLLGKPGGIDILEGLFEQSGLSTITEFVETVGESALAPIIIAAKAGERTVDLVQRELNRDRANSSGLVRVQPESKHDEDVDEEVDEIVRNIRIGAGDLPLEDPVVRHLGGESTIDEDEDLLDINNEQEFATADELVPLLNDDERNLIPDDVMAEIEGEPDRIKRASKLRKALIGALGVGAGLNAWNRIRGDIKLPDIDPDDPRRFPDPERDPNDKTDIATFDKQGESSHHQKALDMKPMFQDASTKEIAEAEDITTLNNEQATNWMGTNFVSNPEVYSEIIPDDDNPFLVQLNELNKYTSDNTMPLGEYMNYTDPIVGTHTFPRYVPYKSAPIYIPTMLKINDQSGWLRTN